MANVRHTAAIDSGSKAPGGGATSIAFVLLSLVVGPAGRRRTAEHSPGNGPA